VRPLRIGLDVSTLTRPHPRGVARVTAGLAAALERRGNVEVVRLEPEPAADLRRWRAITLPRIAAERKLDGIHACVSAFAFRGPGARFHRLDFAVARWGVGFQRRQQPMGDSGNFVDCPVESRLIRFRRLGEAAQLPYELQRRATDFLLRGGRLEVEQRFDVQTHVQ